MVGYGFPGDYYLDNFFTPLPADVNEGLKTAFLSVGIMALVHRRGHSGRNLRKQFPTRRRAHGCGPRDWCENAHVVQLFFLPVLSDAPRGDEREDPQ
jgi:hypothetical protein